jgi:hypothetical protein
MSDAALAELLAEMSDALDLRLADQRRADAVRDASRCRTADEAADVSRRFEIAQLAGDDDAPAIEGRLQ